MTQKPETPPEPGPAPLFDTRLAQSVQRSAQEIWLAGMGAFAKAQEEGGKVFESLVRDGVELQRRTHAAAEERIVEASSRLGGLGSQAGEQWGRLESIFEERVARAFNRLGMPSTRDVQALQDRIDALTREVAALRERAAERSGDDPRASAPDAARSGSERQQAATQPAGASMSTPEAPPGPSAAPQTSRRKPR